MSDSDPTQRTRRARRPTTSQPGGTPPESVWDYPRPPALEPTSRRLEVVFGGRVVADTRRGLRVLETSHPPNYYFPPEDVDTSALRPSPGLSLCEWKGRARYLTLEVGDRRAERAVWTYDRPTSRFAALSGYFAFYPGLMDECRVDGEAVEPQPGGFYGGWITRDVTGPFKGGFGTLGW